MGYGLWLVFVVMVLVMLAVDFSVFNRRPHEIKIKEALVWSVIWVVVALAFNAGVYFFSTKERAVNFLTGYLIERALSMDNIFVFLLIFQYFRVPRHHQHRVLFLGILGALVLRAIFIAAGVTLINAFHWTIYLLGAFLIFVGIKMFFQKDKGIDLEKNVVLKFVKKLYPVTEDYQAEKFFVQRDGARWATPLFIVFLAVVSMDLVFAVDSIPAILAITTDPFVVYTSNIFAVLGLIAFYFALAALSNIFHYLNYGLSLILALVGVKMIASDLFHIPVGWTLGTVVAILLVSIFASVIYPKEAKEK